MTEEKKIRKCFSMKDLPCDNVVVFSDRAEVRRLIQVKLDKGETEIVLSDVSNNIDEDSVRVEGKGDATVLDVVCQSKRVQSDEVNSNDKVKEMQSEIKELELKIEKTKQKKERLSKQLNVLNDFACTLSKPANGLPDDKKNIVLNSSKENVENFLEFLNRYSDRMENLDESAISVNNELSKLEEQLHVKRDNLSKQSTSSFHFLKYDFCN